MLNHWFSPENSLDPESDRGPTGASTPHNLVTSLSWNLPGSGAVLGGWRLSTVTHSQSGSPYTIRYAGDPVGYGAGVGAACNSRGCQTSTPGGRNTARGMFMNYADLTIGKQFPVGSDHIEFRADVFNMFNNQNLLSGGYINLVGNARYGEHTGGGNVLPEPSVPVCADVSLLRNTMRICLALVLSAVVSATALVSTQSKTVRVRVQTELGDIVIEVDPVKAPVTTANFLKYVDGGHYDGGVFHRTVKMDNQPESTVKIEVIQAGVNPERAKEGFPAIPLERTSVTGILHKDAVVSMARGAPDSATSGWFVCINDQPSLDFGGNRNPDGQGFGAFGRVVTGMDVVRKIQAAPSSATRTTNTEAQRLTPPIKILKVARVPSLVIRG